VQAAILAKKLEQVALQQAMDEKLAEIQQQESEITRLKGRVASLVGKANGVEVSPVVLHRLCRPLSLRSIVEKGSPAVVAENQKRKETLITCPEAEWLCLKARPIEQGQARLQGSIDFSFRKRKHAIVPMIEFRRKR
jgi:hypothetical protein